MDCQHNFTHTQIYTQKSVCTLHETSVEVHASTPSLHIGLVYCLGSKLCIFYSEQNEQVNSWRIPTTCCQNLQLHF